MKNRRFSKESLDAEMNDQEGDSQMPEQTINSTQNSGVKVIFLYSKFISKVLS